MIRGVQATRRRAVIHGVSVAVNSLWIRGAVGSGNGPEINASTHAEDVSGESRMWKRYVELEGAGGPKELIPLTSS